MPYILAGTIVSLVITTLAFWRRFVVEPDQLAHYPYLFTFLMIIGLNLTTLGLLRQGEIKVAVACTTFCIFMSIIVGYKVFF